MAHTSLGRAQRTLLVLSLVIVALVAAPPLAHAAASWQSGPLVEVQDSNCITGQVEYEAGSYLSYFADPSNPPQVGQVYYVALDIAGIGDTCAGAYGSFQLSLPSGTAPAISAANPVRCYLKPRNANTYTNVAGNCPQSLGVGPHGYYLNPTNTNPPFWPIVQGDAVEVQVPVVSTVPLNGTDQFHAFIQLADGETDPFMAPSLLAIVNPSGSQNVSGTNKQIGIVYANPTITGQSTNGDSSVNANFLGYIENNSNPGTAYAELAKADAAGDCTSPVLFNPTIKSNIASLQNPQTQITGMWSPLYPDGAYCFRLVAVVSSGPQAGTYYGNWQYFATKGNFLSNPGTSQYVPPPAHPITGTGCTSGAGCATSNCATGSACNQTGSVAGAAHVLTVTRAGTGSGSVASGASNGASIACPNTCSQTYPTGAHAQSVTLTATPAAGSRFTGWSGGGCAGAGACTVSMSADQAVTATFMLIPKPPPPPPAPRCTLGARSASVLLHAHKRRQRASVGRITFAARCDQATSATLSSVLTETLGRKHGKPQFKTFRLGPRHLSLAANVSQTVSFKLPGTALSGLSQHRSEKLLATLSASNAHGSTRATLTIKKLLGQS